MITSEEEAKQPHGWPDAPSCGDSSERELQLEKAGSVSLLPMAYVREVEEMVAPDQNIHRSTPSTDTFAELHTALANIKELASRHAWQPVPPSPLEFRLRSVDNASVISSQALAALVNYASERLGIALQLRGGGYGCFDLGFASEQDQSSALEQAIVNDPHFQSLLNGLNVHTALIRTQNGARTYSAFYQLKLGIATNRNKQPGTVSDNTGVTELFGGDLSNEMWYGLAEVWVLDLSHSQPKESLLKRVWRRATLGFGDFQERRSKALISRIDLLGATEFKQLLTSFAGHGAVVMIHGYANSFDDAVSACALGAHKARFEQLQLFPVIFSWPSHGSAVRYLPDTSAAENSEYALHDFLRLVASAAVGREVDVMAHSHGNKLLVRSLCSDKRASDSVNVLKRLILVEPDVDQEFLRQRAALLSVASEQIIIYHSQNDRALALAEFLFNSIRIGQYGLTSTDIASADINRIEVIDASRVARGLSRHSPHLDSPEVISDIYHLLCGMKPDERFHLRQLDVRAGRWEMIPVEA